MAYIGQNADGNFTTSISKDTFSGNGSTTAFTLSEAATTNTVDVFVENIRQEPTTAYTVDGTTLTFTAAPVSGTNNIYVVNRGPIQLSASHPAAQSLSAFSATITNDLTVDTNTLFVDASENAVGINKSAPAIAMDIVAANNSQLRIDSSDTNDTTFFLDYNGGGATNRIRIRNAAGDLAFNVANTSEAMRIDSSGNLLVSTTSDFASGTVDGIIAQGTAKPAAAFSNTADGQIVKFYQGGNLVAGISVGSSDNISFDALTGGGAGLLFWGAGGTDPYITPRAEGSDNDNVTSLGRGANRFKDLYLGGNIYLGGTGSANALDDYEEGTFTVTLLTTGSPNPTYTIANNTGYYTKVGRLVTANFYSGAINMTNAGSGAARISGLPFNATTTTYGQYSVVSFTHTTAFTSNAEGGITIGDSTQIAVYAEGSVSSMAFTTGNPLYMMFTVTYWTD